MGNVTENERLFLELQLKVALRKRERSQKLGTGAGSGGMISTGNRALQKEIQNMGNQYIRETVCSGLGAYILAGEKDKMFQEMERVMNHPDIKNRLRKALYQDGDLNQVKRLSLELRVRIGQLLNEYESHIQEGRAS